MDHHLRSLRRQAATEDSAAVKAYIAALEQVVGISDDDPPTPRLYLLSIVGERHEDRLPIGVFDTLDGALDECRRQFENEWQLRPHDKVSVITDIYRGDYGEGYTVWVGLEADPTDHDHPNEYALAFLIDSDFYLNRSRREL